MSCTYLFITVSLRDTSPQVRHSLMQCCPIPVISLSGICIRSFSPVIPLRDMYARFGRVYHGQQTRKKLVYREQSHINEIMHVTLPLENEEYAKLPGQPEWNNKDLLDDEDKL